MIAVFRKRYRLPQQFEIARFHRSGQVIDLIAGIIDVKLFLHIIAGCLHQIGQRTAECRAAAMTHMQRSGRIGADKLDLDFLPLSGGGIAICLTLIEDFLQQSVQPIRFQIKVDKAGAGDFRPIQPGHLQPGNYRFSNFSRVCLERPCRLHGKVGGKITKTLLRRSLQQNWRQLGFRQYCFVHGICCSPQHCSRQYFLYIHSRSSCDSASLIYANTCLL